MKPSRKPRPEIRPARPSSHSVGNSPAARTLVRVHAKIVNAKTLAEIHAILFSLGKAEELSVRDREVLLLAALKKRREMRKTGENGVRF